MENNDQVYKVKIVGGKTEIVRKEEHPLQKFWRPAAAIVYLFICIFDFVLAPIWVGYTADNLSKTINTIKDLPPNLQQIVLEEDRSWSPLTLLGGGLFHLSFGAIIGVAAATRGMEKTARVKKENGED